MSDQMFILGLDPREFAQIDAMLKSLPANAKFGASVGMNRTANEMQDAIRQSLPGHFTLRRRAFIESTVYRKPGEDFASKDHLVAGVRIHDERNVLAKFEAGGFKTPMSGKTIAIPLAARPSKGAIVPQKFTLKALFFAQQGVLSQAGAILSTKGKGKRKTLLKRSQANDLFIRNGILFQAPKNHRGRPKALWLFKPQSKLPPDLHFVTTGSRVARDRLALNVIGAMQLEIDRGLTSKSGPAS